MPQFVDGGVNAVIKLDVGIVRPKLASKLLAADDFTGLLQQREKNARRLFRHANRLAIFLDLASCAIQNEGAELHKLFGY